MVGLIKTHKNEFLVQTTGKPGFSVEDDSRHDGLVECAVIAVKKKCNWRSGCVISVKPEQIENITPGWWYSREGLLNEDTFRYYHSRT